MNDALFLSIVIPLVLFIGVPAIGFAAAAFGGWRALARHYATSEPFHGKRFWFRSAQFGLIAYNSCFMPGTNAEGIYLALLLPFRIGHPPLLVPWQDVSCSKAHSFIISRAELRFSKAPEVSIVISQKLADLLFAARDS
jgi:hypothetical protein